MSSHYRYWGQSLLRGGLGALLLCCAAVVGAQSSSQQTGTAELLGQSFDFDVPAQKVSTAILEIARQAQIQALMAGNVLDAYQTEALDERLSLAEALDRVLSGTPYAYQQTGRNAIMVGTPEALQEQSTLAGQNQIGQRQPGIEEIIVTGQKREERIQDVPIAISAFSPEDLEAQKIEGGFDLLKGVPNVSFTKTNFTGYNFQIRGVGTQAVSATTDPGVAVSFNNTTLIVNRLFEQEYLDVERVEVLRGPQGTLFGRNATGGVINVITNKPEMGVWDGMIDVEVGNYNTRRLRGMFNAPIGDELAIRSAYASTQRDGFGINTAHKDPLADDDVSRDVDDRDLWTGRLSLGWQPSETFRLNLIWERFEEDDHRARTSKQLCHRDPGESMLEVDSRDEPVDVTALDNPFLEADLSQGCAEGSLYSDGAFGTPRGETLPYVSGFYEAVNAGRQFGGTTGVLPMNNNVFGLGGNPFYDTGNADVNELYGLRPEDARCEFEKGLPNRSLFVRIPGVSFNPLNLCRGDIYADPETGEPRTQSRDLRTIHSKLQPQYRAQADIVELSFDWEWTDELLFSSQTVYVDDEYSATQDYNRFTTPPVWNDSTIACNNFTAVRIGGLRRAGPNCNPDFTPRRSDPGGVGDYADGFYAGLSPDGVVCDPQLGCSRSLIVQDLARSEATQYNQEFRLVSSYPGDWNFSLGANYTKFRTTVDYFVFSNAFTHVLNFGPFNSHRSYCVEGRTNLRSDLPPGRNCRYVDPNPLEEINGEGHNYFRSANPYDLTSSALFGELYWNATDTVKFTLGLRMSWDKKVFTPIPSQLLLSDARQFLQDVRGEPEGTPAQECVGADCAIYGNAPNGRGSPADPPIEQNWREPTGRFVVDWQPNLGFTDETMAYASFSRGYKGGGANPPSVAPPARAVFAKASAASAPDTFEPEFVNAYEIGTKNTLFGGALVLNATGFYYDYSDYQISKIVDRRAVNENFDSEIWGAELEMVFAPSLSWQFNAQIGWLRTEVAEGEKSIDLMDRAQGGNRHFAADPDAIAFDGETTDFPDGFDRWTVLKPASSSASNCIAPTELVAAHALTAQQHPDDILFNDFSRFCPAGNLIGTDFRRPGLIFHGTVSHFDEDGNLVQGAPPAFFNSNASQLTYDPDIDAPNGGAGFFADLSGNKMPNSPEFTVALGGQYNFDLTRDWRATARVDYYWQDSSFARVYNTEIDRLKSWSNTNLSFWITNPNSGITVEGYVKNVFDETPITGTFLNSDDTGLTTNVFTLDPRLIGVSVRKEF